MAESAEPCLTAAEKVIVTSKNLKSDVWKYFGFWAIDGKLVEPTAKVVCKLCKLALAYDSTTSNLRLHLQNVHPSEYVELQRNSHVWIHILRRPSQVRCLRHDRRPARKNVFRSYARTRGRSVWWMGLASGSSVKHWNRGTVSHFILR